MPHFEVFPLAQYMIATALVATKSFRQFYSESTRKNVDRVRRFVRSDTVQVPITSVSSSMTSHC
jgi:hypothetical protein